MSTEKESSALTARAVLFGILLGSLLNFLSIYLSYKIGISAIGGTFILGYLLLKLTGEYDYKENAVMMMIVGAMNLPSIGVAGNMATLVVFKDYLSMEIELSMTLILVISVVGTFMGLVLLYPLRRQFLELKWPLVLPIAQIIKVIGEKGEYLKKALYGLVSAIVVTASTIAANVRTIKTKWLPSFIGFEISPLMLGIGYFITFTGSLLIFVGALYSIAIWYFIEGASADILISEHIMHPAIFSIAIPMMVTTAIVNIVENRKVLISSIRDLRRNDDNDNSLIPSWLSFGTLFFLPVVSYIALSFVPGLTQSLIFDVFTIILIAIPIVFVSAIFLARSRGETGFSMSFTVDVVLIIVAILLLPSLEDLLIAFAILGSYEVASLIFLNYMKFGQLTDIPEKDVFKAIIIGIIPGALVTAVSIWSFQYLLGGLGTEAFPTPNAYAIGGYLFGMLEALGKGIIPEMYDPLLVVISIVLTILLIIVFKRLKIRGLTPITLAIGMIVPPAYVFPIFLGGLLELWVRRKYGADQEKYTKVHEDMTVILSGVIGGEGIVLLIITLAMVVFVLL